MIRGHATPVADSLGRLFTKGTMTGAGEGQLLDRFLAERDEAAFEVLGGAARADGARASAMGVLGDASDVEDAFQATFLVLVKKGRHARRARYRGGPLARPVSPAGWPCTPGPSAARSTRSGTGLPGRRIGAGDGRGRRWPISGRVKAPAPMLDRGAALVCRGSTPRRSCSARFRGPLARGGGSRELRLAGRHGQGASGKGPGNS